MMRATTITAAVPTALMTARVVNPGIITRARKCRQDRGGRTGPSSPSSCVTRPLTRSTCARRRATFKAGPANNTAQSAAMKQSLKLNVAFSVTSLQASNRHRSKVYPSIRSVSPLNQRSRITGGGGGRKGSGAPPMTSLANAIKPEGWGSGPSLRRFVSPKISLNVGWAGSLRARRRSRTSAIERGRGGLGSVAIAADRVAQLPGPHHPRGSGKGWPNRVGQRRTFFPLADRVGQSAPCRELAPPHGVVVTNGHEEMTGFFFARLTGTVPSGTCLNRLDVEGAQTLLMSIPWVAACLLLGPLVHEGTRLLILLALGVSAEEGLQNLRTLWAPVHRESALTSAELLDVIVARVDDGIKGDGARSEDLRPLFKENLGSPHLFASKDGEDHRARVPATFVQPDRIVEEMAGLLHRIHRPMEEALC